MIFLAKWNQYSLSLLRCLSDSPRMGSAIVINIIIITMIIFKLMSFYAGTHCEGLLMRSKRISQARGLMSQHSLSLERCLLQCSLRTLRLGRNLSLTMRRRSCEHSCRFLHVLTINLHCTCHACVQVGQLNGEQGMKM